MMKGHDFHSLIDTGTIFPSISCFISTSMKVCKLHNSMHSIRAFFSRANTGINTSTFTISFRPQMKKSKVSFIKGVGGKTVLRCKPNTGKKKYIKV